MDAPYRSPLQVAQVNPQQVQPPQDQPTEVKKPKNPARKWLMVSAAGVAICLFALGIGALRGGDSNLNPLPKKVLAQVFGFTPYYFNKDTPPAHLKLDATTPKFFGNALTFTLTDPKQEKITITQQTLPTGNFKRLTGDTTPTPLGEATIKMGGGKIEAELITKDNTYINIKASDFVSSGTLIDIFGNMSAAPKGAEALKQQ
jgi:hypothetical protein